MLLRRLPFAFGLALVFSSACGDDTQDGVDGPGPVLLGSIRVNWSLADTEGVAMTCDEARITGVRVLVAGLESNIGLDGGTPDETPIDCDLGMTVFSGVPEGRYPVRVRLMRNNSIVSEDAQNVNVVADEEALSEFAFVIDRSQTGDRGDMRVRWTIDRREPADTCAEFGATSLQIITDVSSIEQFDVTAPCVDGATVITSLLAGRYSLRLRLLDSAGTGITTSGVLAQVVAGEVTNTDVVNLVPTNIERGRLVGLWTVNTTVAVDACEVVGGQTVELALIPPGSELVPDPVTSSCAVGRAELNDLIDEGLFGVRFQLVYDAGLSVTSTIIDAVRIRRGETTTVTIDLETL